jgi:hypothetical protein
MTSAELHLELERSRAALLAPLAGLSEEQFRYAAQDGGWPIVAHLAHVLRIERLFVDRIRLAIEEDEPAVVSTGATNEDDPGLAQRHAVPQIIHGLQASRRDLMQILGACGEMDMRRAIRHERIGRVTVEQMAEKMRDHDAEHAETILAVAEAARTARRIVIPLAQKA